ncbi:MAG: DNA methyltransferase [Chloroflexota bacterium]|nr:DNA methyltransferase [Chloroflexota bacterium]MDE2970312.1 DNA methyltransferase [Chloroflexota bacterium]
MATTFPTTTLDSTHAHSADKTKFESAFHSSDRVQGLTHDFYKYPARFSPQFVRSILDRLTEPGDYVLDPFMGGGTTIVEAIASGRRAIGSDINELSHFVTRVKSTPLSKQDASEILEWVAAVKQATTGLDSMPTLDPSPIRNMPIASYSFFHAATKLVARLGLARRRRFARCALIRVGQWALDSRLHIPSNADIADHLEQRVYGMLKGLAALVSGASENGTYKNKITADRLLLPYAAANPLLVRVLNRRGISPKLILTSPPYPGVHVLYHRWQIHGRRETSAPYWIADLRDGHGEGYYTMGSRSTLGLKLYFEKLGAAFKNLRAIASLDTAVVQLVAFSHAETQLPLYLAAMEDAGFTESAAGPIGGSRQERVVPNRKWYNQGKTLNDASTEVLLIHKPTG